MTRRIVFLACLLCLAALEFLYRGPVRALQSGGGADLAAPYAAARAWVAGQNPYDQTLLSRILVDAGRERQPSGRPLFTMSVYPPTTFVGLAPLADVSWPTARLVWTLLMVGGVGLAIWSLLRVTSAPSFTGRWRLGLAASTLALAPFHTAIARGQPAVLSIALLCLSLAAMDADSSRLGGSVLGLAVIFKPQIAGPFLLFAALRKQWRSVVWCSAVVAVALVIGVGWLAYHNVPWLQTWMNNLHRESVGGEIDPTGPLAAQMVDFRPLLTAFGVSDATLIGAVLSVILLAGILAWSRRAIWKTPLLVAAALSTWTVLSGYHRFYDAAVIAIPIAWALRELADRGALRATAIVTLSAAAAFLLPGAWMLHLGAESGAVPPLLAQSWFFRAVLLPHQVWALIIMLIVLTGALRTQSSVVVRENG